MINNRICLHDQRINKSILTSIKKRLKQVNRQQQHCKNKRKQNSQRTINNLFIFIEISSKNNGLVYIINE